MAYQPFYIEAFQTGLETDVSSFQLLPDAFDILQDCFVWRKRVRRKLGYSQIGRAARILTGQSLGNTSGSPHAGNIKTTLSWEANAQIKQGSVTITVAAPSSEIFTEPATPDGTLTGDGGGSGTINYATGAYSITSGAGWGAGQAITINVTYFPALPIMGIFTREVPNVNAEETMCFDTKYAYEWDSTNKQFEEMDPTAGLTWNGTDSDFFWAYNYRSAATASTNILMETNFNKSGTPDPMYVYDEGAAAGSKRIIFNPPVTATNQLHQARILIPFKGRVLALNTWEGTAIGTAVNIPQRARWSQIGDFIETLPISGSTAWRDDIPGNGGYVDAPTSEHIISTEFVRDTLVVGFEKSHWRLRDTGNPILPFSWERIDNEFGIESTFSIVKLGNMQMGVGATGIVASDALNVKRIDEKIPDAVFSIQNQNDGPKRIHGIRDYDKELIYWTFPNSNINRTFPNEMFVYNYRDQTWSFFKDSFTAFGYFQEFNDQAWQDFTTTTWAEADFTWVSASLQALYPDVIGGNQHGYLCKMQKLSRNDPAASITVIASGTPGVITIPDHNLQTGNFVRFSGILGTASSLNDRNFRVSYISDNTFSLAEYDSGTETFQTVTIAGGTTYLGGGEMALLHDFRARMKKFNALQVGATINFGYIDFQTNVTTSGQFNVNVYLDNNTSDPVNINDNFFNTTVGTSLYTGETPSQDKVVHRFFSHIEGRLLQFELSLSDIQLSNISIHDSDIQIFSMILWSERGGRLS